MSKDIKIEWIECADVPSNVVVKVEDATDSDVAKNLNSSPQKKSPDNMNSDFFCQRCKKQIPDLDNRKHMFKVWNRTREKKVMVLVQEPNILSKVISKASEKLQMKGTQLVLHTDGTAVDEDDILIMLKTETWILLGDHEKWIPENYNFRINSPLSIQSTKTVRSIDESSQISEETENEDITLKPADITSKSLEITPKSLAITSQNSEITPKETLEFLPTNTKTCNMPCNCTPMQNFWANYSIPWQKIPQSLLNSCLEGLRDKFTMTAMCHFVIDEMMSVNGGVIPSSAMRKVTWEIVERFPQSFRDVDDQGFVAADGYSSLLRKLKERYSYLRRSSKRPGLRSAGRSIGCFSEASVSNECLDYVDTAENLFVHEEEVNPLETSCKSEDTSYQSIETSLPTTTIKDDPIKINFSEENAVLVNYFTNKPSNLDVSWCNWAIPWHKMPPGLLRSCEEGSREKQTINKICRFIIDEMFSVNTHITAKALRAVARQFLNRYPKCFCEIDREGFVVDDGFKPLFFKLNERACYLRRPGRRKCEKTPYVVRRKDGSPNMV